jgi:hypothetical protein
MPQISDEQLEAFKELLDQARPKSHSSVIGPDPSHRGVIDAGYVRGSDVREFPKMVYRESKKDARGFETKIVKTEEEQKALSKGWLTAPKDVHTLLERIERARLGETEDVDVKDK